MLCKMNVFKVVMKVFSAIKNWLYKYMGKKQCLPVTEVNVSKDVRCFYEQLEGLLPLEAGGLRIPTSIVGDVQFLYHTQGFPHKVLLGMGGPALDIADLVLVRYTDRGQHKVLRISHEVLVEFYEQMRRGMLRSLRRHRSLQRQPLAKGYVQKSHSSILMQLEEERDKGKEMRTLLIQKNNKIEALEHELAERAPKEHTLKLMEEHERVRKEQENVNQELKELLSQQDKSISELHSLVNNLNAEIRGLISLEARRDAEVEFHDVIKARERAVKLHRAAYLAETKENTELLEMTSDLAKQISELDKEKVELQNEIKSGESGIKKYKSHIRVKTKENKTLQRKISEQAGHITRLKREKMKAQKEFDYQKVVLKSLEETLCTQSEENRCLRDETASKEIEIRRLNTHNVELRNEIKTRKFDVKRHEAALRAETKENKMSE